MSDIPSQPIPYYSGAPAIPFAGLRMGSRTLGVIAMVLGGLSGCTAAALPLTWIMPRPASDPHLRVGHMIGSALEMLAFTVALIYFGVGAWRLRRWTRPLAITGGTIWLLGGTMSLIAIVFRLPHMRSVMHRGRASAPISPGADWAVLGFIIALFVAFGIVVPAAFVWFYKKPLARHMLEYYDPQPRWTDGCPLPVLGLTVSLAILGVLHVLTAPAAIDTIFGIMLFGLPAAALMLLEGTVSSLLAWLVFLRRPAGWWGSVALTIIWTVSWAAMIFRPHHTAEMYYRAGYSDEEIAAVNGAGNVAVQLTAGATVLFAFGYLFYFRRYFSAAAIPLSTPPVE